MQDSTSATDGRQGQLRGLPRHRFGSSALGAVSVDPLSPVSGDSAAQDRSALFGSVLTSWDQVERVGEGTASGIEPEGSEGERPGAKGECPQPCPRPSVAESSGEEKNVGFAGNPSDGELVGVGGAEKASHILIDEVKSVVAYRVRSYGEKVRESRRFGGFLLGLGSDEAQERGKKLCDCGSALWFRHYPDRPEIGAKLSKLLACQQAALCDFCGARASATALARAVPKVLSVLDEAGGRLVPYLLTVTQPTGPGWRSQAERFWGYWSTAVEMRRNALKGLRRWSVFADLAGGIMAGESKLSTSEQHAGEVHYHGHAVVVGRPGLALWPPLAEGVAYSRRWEDEGLIFWARERWPGDKKGWACGPLVDEWRAILGNPDANLNLQPLRGVEKMRGAGFTWGEMRDGIGNQLLEVFRYLQKHEGMSDEERWKSYQELTSPRLQQRRSFGKLYGCDPKPEFADDLSGLENEKFIETCWRYLQGSYVLQGRRSALTFECEYKRRTGQRDYFKGARRSSRELAADMAAKIGEEGL